ncbi:unnamed protein product [Pleuronectes platessa]|uniref:Uncharacterized protein n=1 Tax=Pleuronectes platessa TaxID=8262 RepID=A0A9N7URC8_PLEPL|nr:unnamed protein product [Pleuronectes platessa]
MTAARLFTVGCCQSLRSETLVWERLEKPGCYQCFHTGSCHLPQRPPEEPPEPERHDRRQGVWTLLRSSRAPEQSACPSTTSALKHTQDKLILQSSALSAPTHRPPRLPDSLTPSLCVSDSRSDSPSVFNPPRAPFACIASSSTIHTSGWISGAALVSARRSPKDGSHDPVTYPSAQSAGCQRRAGWDAQSSTSDSLAPSQSWMPED